jgi:hypothetical protein
VFVAAGAIVAALALLLTILIVRKPARHGDAPTPAVASALAPASASAAGSASAAASASAGAAAVNEPAASATAPEAVAAPAAVAPFSGAAAKRALDGTSRDVLKCHRGKVWGVGSAWVTFANDGTVSRVVLGGPFHGTPCGDCVTEALSAAHVAPFLGKPGSVNYRFFVAAK